MKYYTTTQREGCIKVVSGIHLLHVPPEHPGKIDNNVIKCAQVVLFLVKPVYQENE